MMFGWLVLSAGFLLVVSLATVGGSRPSYVGAIVLSFAAAAFALCAGSTILLWNALLVSLVALACHVSGTRRRTFVATSVIGTVVAYLGVIVFLAIPEQREWARLEESYPIESLTERLQYEQRAKKSPVAVSATQHALNSPRFEMFESSLDEQSGKVQLREISLKRLHESSVNRFIDSQGFGVGRMMRWRPSASQVELPEPEPIPMPVYRDGRPHASAIGQSRIPDTIQEELKQGADVHEDSLLSFFNPRGFGYVPDRDHVVGFQPHAFFRAPQVASQWWIDRLELVSLLRHEEPAVYLSEHLPRMQELREADTRPLDDFEQEALAALRRGEDIKEQSTPDRIRMLGAIRAAKQCLKCHSVERGELLGAFSYDLRREP
jgi:hypothetical protein